MHWADGLLVARGGVGAFLALFFSGLLFSFPAHSSEKYKKMTQYDSYFLRYASHYFGARFDWRYFKAQAIVESRLRPDVQSQDGAVGIMQILPTTFREITQKNPHISSDPEDPRWNIAAGIYYNWVMWNEWRYPLTLQDRLNFMFAAYNAGKYNILRAQQIAASLGLNPNSWESVERVLSRLKGLSAQETVAYVRKVNHTWLGLQ